jgi:metal transporter CNNM
MTPINDVFMLSIDSKLDYETLREICATGHSRVPVYEEVEVPTSGVIEARNKAGSAIAALPSPDGKEGDKNTMTVKRIIGIFLVKQVGDLVA